MLSPLKERSFRLLFSGQVCSDLANWLDFLALISLIVYHWGLGADAIAALLITIGIPWVIIGPIASVWTYRLPAKPVMIACDGLRMAILFCMIWAPSLFLLLLLVFLKGTLSSIFDPVRQSSIRLLVSVEQLPQASSLSQLSLNLTKILAPAIGGGIIAFSGPQTSFLAGGLLYGLSGILLSRLPAFGSSYQESENPEVNFLQQFKQGWLYIRQQRPLFLAVYYISLGMFFVFLYDGLFVLFTSKVGFGESGLGWLMSAVGLGSVLGSIAVGHWTGWKESPLSFMGKSGFITGIFIMIIGWGGIGAFTLPLYFWLLIFFFLGWNGARSSVPFGFILQTQTPLELIGRVSSATQAIQSIALLMAPALGAWLSKWLGVGGVFILVGGLMLLSSMVFLLMVRQTSFSPLASQNQIEAS